MRNILKATLRPLLRTPVPPKLKKASSYRKEVPKLTEEEIKK